MDITSALNSLTVETGEGDYVKTAYEILAKSDDSATYQQDAGTFLNQIGIAIHERFQASGSLKDLDGSIDLHREALVLHPLHHPKRAASLSILGQAIQTRFQLRQDPKDLDDMIEFYEEALALYEPPHADRGSSLSNMANALVMRFAQHRELKDLDEAVKLRREALDACPPLDSSRSTYLHELAMVLRTRFQRQGNLQDIDQGILLLREGLGLCASGDLRRGMWINDLADAIQLVFNMRGDIKDMDEAIKLRREFLVLRPQGHPDRDIALDNLGNALSTRFTLRGDSKDLDETIDLYREALRLRPLGHPEHGSALNNLIDTLRNRAGSIGNEQDMDEVIALYQRALALFEPNNPGRYMILDNLGTAVQNRFERQKRPEDLEEAISLHRQALALRPPNHRQHSTSLNTLTIALRIRFQEQGSVTDLEEAIQLHRRALDLEPPPHPARGITLMHLAQCLAAMPRSHNSNVLDEAFARFEETTTYLFSSPLMRFRGAHSWAESAVAHNHSSSLAAYGTAIALIPQLAPLDLDISSRQQMLSKLNISTLVRDATACAIGLGQNNRAVELLEAARSVFWSQSLQMRLPLDDLATVRPDLSGRLFLLSNELEQTSLRYNARIPAENPNQQQLMSMETDSVRYRMLKQELDTAIESVRRLEGFEDFMGPKTMAKLQKAAVHGPIVVLTATGINCSALIVTPDSDVQHVQLPLEIQSIPSSEFPPTLLNIRALFSGDGRGIDSTDQNLDLLARLIGMQDRGNLSTEDTLRWLLTELWKKAVKPVFNALKFEKSNNPPRLWWCPTGPFAFLPIHAAGIYEENDTDCVSEYVVSSYTTTIAALLARDSLTPTGAPFKMTAIIQPDVPNYMHLPGAREEVEKIMTRVPQQWLTTLGNATTVETSLANVRQSAIVHFACHEIQDLKQPLESGLILSDGHLRVSEIMRRSDNVNIPGAMALAFLNTCETARGDAKVVNEAMHLAGTLMFAGFRRVVATTWDINEADGPKVADAFYEHLFKDCDPTQSPPILPDVTKSAEALHVAVAKLRSEPGITFKRWVPFVHYGL